MSANKYNLRYINRCTAEIRTQQYIQLITGVKEIQKINLGERDHRHNIRPEPPDL